MQARTHRHGTVWGRSLLAVAVLVAGSCSTPRHAGAPRIHSGSGHDATSQHSFADAKRWALVFDDPGRDAWQKPGEIVAALELRPGMTVADLGAGTGYFERYLSQAVGAQGTVLAVDTEPALVEHIRARAAQDGITNVVPIFAAYDDPRLPQGSVDRILIVDTYHHINDRLNYFERLRTTVKPGGRVAIVDWHKRELPEGPPLDHKLSREQVIEEMRVAGYVLVDEPDLVPYQYVLIFAVGKR